MAQELDFIKFKKHLDVKIGDSIVRIEYDILTDAITVSCDGNSFSFDTTENKYPIYKGIFDMGVDITPRDTNYLLFMLKNSIQTLESRV